MYSRSTASATSAGSAVWLVPPRLPGVLTGLILIAAALALALAALSAFLRLYPHPLAIGLAGLAVLAVAAAGVLGGWTACLATLRYALWNDSVFVVWAGTIYRIPLSAITDLVAGRDAGRLTAVRGLTWWGSGFGHAASERLGPVCLLATDRSPDRLLFLVTPEAVFGLTIDPESPFADLIRDRRRAHPPGGLPRAYPDGWWALALWQDHLFWAIGGLAGAVVCAVWAAALALGAGLRSGQPIHLGSMRLAGPDDLLALVAIGAVLWLMDLLVGALLHPWEPVAARLLALAGLLVQVTIGAALLALWLTLGSL